MIKGEVLSLIINCIVIILGVIISLIGSCIAKFIKLKNDELIKRIGIVKYNRYKSLALDVWNIVDEYFRVNTSINRSINTKIKMFDNELNKKCPELSQEDIDFLRQTIAGEINKCKQVICSFTK